MSPKTMLLLAFCALAAARSASAGVLNGGFETGDLSGWTKVGSGHAAGSEVGVSPPAGSYQGYIETTGNFTAMAPAVVASLGLDSSDIMGLAIGAAPTNGTGLSQDVTVSAGDTLTFDWNFLTDELDEDSIYNDYGFFSVDGSAFLLASRNSSIYNTVSPPAGFDGQTNYSTYTYVFPSSGTVKIGFGVFNVIDSGHNSALLLDSVTITSVPEPSTVALLAIGLTAVALGSCRRRKASLGVE